MAPAKKAKAKAAPAPAPQGAVSAGSSSSAAAPAPTDEYLTKVLEAKRVVLEHAMFKGVDKLGPLEKCMGGCNSPCDDTVMEAALSASQVYTCASNLFAVDLVWSATPGVPVLFDRVKRVADHNFATPSVQFPFDLTTAAPEANYKASSCVGTWQLISPEEFCHAALFAIQRDILNNVDAVVLTQWKTMLNVPFTFRVMPSPDDMYWFSANQRELSKSASGATR